MSSPYKDVFKEPISDKDVEFAVRIVITRNNASAAMLQRVMKIGYGKSATLLTILEKAKVVSTKENGRSVIIKSLPTAINAALRQLNLGTQS